jgi:5-methylcytosine-specific restriction endonuclease McrA
MSEEIKTKWCNSGQHYQPLERFSKDASTADGLQFRCKDCYQLYRANNREQLKRKKKGYYESNKELISQKGKAKYEQNKEAILARNKEYNEAHRDELLAYKKRHYRKNKRTYRNRSRERHRRYREGILKQWRERFQSDPEYRARILENCKSYRQNHPELVKAWSHKRIARKQAASGMFTKEQWLDKCAYHGWRCYLCGVPLTKFTAEPEHRKPLSRGGSNWIANIAPACARCNRSKGSKTESEFRAIRRG